MRTSAATDQGRRILDQVRTGSGAGLTSLSPAFAGHPGVWLWSGEPGGQWVVKYAEPSDRDAVKTLRREVAVLTVLAPTRVVPEVRMTFVEDEELAGFAMSFVERCGELALEAPLTVSAFAAALARLHARTWRVPYPPFGLDLPVAVGGHTLWIGGLEILSGMCRELVGGPCEAVAGCLMEALEVLDTIRGPMDAHFAPEDMVLVHGDVAGGNLVFHRDGLLLSCSFIDFGEAVIAPPQYDLARYAIGANLTADQEDLLLNIYGSHIRHLTGATLPEAFRDGFALQKPFAVFDTKIASYVIYAANGLPVDPDQALRRTTRGLAWIRAALDRG